ncbi:hypothetical protein HRW23_13975 [Streptomyces lunaelactis]|uniref:hypothetical protein n=1 Tax=Streptomyces lunaelactis TaxID=1535768 RepID=UPI001584DF3E|nr:hypothetical protein [Streptomyces lunaelactis]NUK00323.1 hypothetical protein [Streptomyces lunaelactis]NUK14919.1 hypothetical protein [Streptomyces lunaelactis]NUK22112.1 hypothetical protein [Streptomyces lunaelactis]NUK34261.1 hypothetical protein [Streptomyces lunaelactis]NUK40523.1 hypothetical protein [Streptomyces lunaelactis]
MIVLQPVLEIHAPEGDDRPPRPTDPLWSFLHGLLTMDVLFASGAVTAALARALDLPAPVVLSKS